MARKRRYIRKSADGRFFLFVDRKDEEIDLDKKTKLWLSSEYLFNESVKNDIEKTKKSLTSMLKWNEIKERFEECQKIKELINKLN